tara:strand:+ start:1524 stop:1814 length:291 start_codon:yes stop_codon:yes gene_type:complete
MADNYFLIIGVIVAIGLSVYVFYQTINKENRIIDPVVVPNAPLRTLIQQLSDKIDDVTLEDRKNKDKIAALQLSDGVSREQTKYLTATVNKANFGS